MKKILVCVDASPRAASVLQTAERLARGVGAKLILFRAVGIPIEVPHEAYAMRPDMLGDLLESNARSYLQELAAHLPPELIERLHAEIGTPWQAICAAAKKDDVDLIVIGSHGYDTLDRVIGTTAARVVNHADRSVLVVRSPERV